jgi:2-amino-4-hydroxy-6-hydroxymethyldihydropteridine diphosphokinase
MRNSVFSATFGTGLSLVTLATTSKPNKNNTEAMSAVRTASTVLKKDFMKEVLILLGTNLGDKRENLAKAIESIGRFGKIDTTSSFYESPAWGYESAASYLNQVLLLHTAIEPELLMQGLLAVEQELGRERLAEGYADRLIDIDILSIDRLVQQTALLELPHPRMHLRRFTLLPLQEVHPDWIHPILGQSVSALLEVCPDTAVPRKLS